MDIVTFVCLSILLAVIFSIVAWMWIANSYAKQQREDYAYYDAEFQKLQSLYDTSKFVIERLNKRIVEYQKYITDHEKDFQV